LADLISHTHDDALEGIVIMCADFNYIKQPWDAGQSSNVSEGP